MVFMTWLDFKKMLGCLVADIATKKKETHGGKDRSTGRKQNLRSTNSTMKDEKNQEDIDILSIRELK